MDPVRKCQSCGHLMVKPEDFGGEDPTNLYCTDCTDDEGRLLTKPHVRQSIIEFWRERDAINARLHVPRFAS